MRMSWHTEYYDYARRDGDEIEGLEAGYSCDVVSIDGANYHLWVPRDLDVAKVVELKKAFQKAARRMGDPVSFTWDWIPWTKIVRYGNKFVVERRSDRIAMSRLHDTYTEARMSQNKVEGEGETNSIQRT